MDNLLCLFDVWKGQSYVNANIFVSSIFSMVSCIVSTTFSVKEIPLEEIHLNVNCQTSPFSIFIHQNTKSTTGLDIYNILEENCKALLNMFVIDVDRVTLPRRPQDVIFEYIF